MEKPIELGKKSQIVGVEHWSTLRMEARPDKMPPIPKGHAIVCGIDEGDGERMFICETLRDVHILFDVYAEGGVIDIAWYYTDALDDAAAA